LSDSEPGEGDDEKEGHATFRQNRGIPHGSRIEQRRELLIEFLDNVNMVRETQQMIIEGQKYNNQKKYVQTMGVFDDWMKEKNYTIDDIINKKIPFTITEFVIQLTRTKKTKPSSVKHHAQILNTMLFLIFGTVQVSAIAQRLTTQAISNLQINNPKYWSIWDIIQLYEYWGERLESNLLSNKEQQVKLASPLISLCFVILEEIANIDLSVSIIDDEEHTAAVCISPKQSRKREREMILREHFQRSPTNLKHQFRTENWEQVDQRYISTRLQRLAQTLGDAGFHSIRSRNQSQQDESNLDYLKIKWQIKSFGRRYTTIISFRRRFVVISIGVFFPPLSIPNISTQHTVETESLNDHESAKVQKSQMQKDDQDVDPQGEAQDSSMTKNSDQTTTAEAQE
ncbi:MAG: hypothetical protein EZS28_030090, partial [Streblomastix strix]